MLKFIFLPVRETPPADSDALQDAVAGELVFGRNLWFFLKKIPF